MEAEKLQRLHDTLAKLAPRGKSGGLGFGSHLAVRRSTLNEDGTPKNGMKCYVRFCAADFVDSVVCSLRACWTHGPAPQEDFRGGTQRIKRG